MSIEIEENEEQMMDLNYSERKSISFLEGNQFEEMKIEIKEHILNPTFSPDSCYAEETPVTFYECIQKITGQVLSTELKEKNKQVVENLQDIEQNFNQSWNKINLNKFKASLPNVNLQLQELKVVLFRDKFLEDKCILYER